MLTPVCLLFQPKGISYTYYNLFDYTKTCRKNSHEPISQLMSRRRRSIITGIPESRRGNLLSLSALGMLTSRWRTVWSASVSYLTTGGILTPTCGTKPRNTSPTPSYCRQAMCRNSLADAFQGKLFGYSSSAFYHWLALLKNRKIVASVQGQAARNICRVYRTAMMLAGIFFGRSVVVWTLFQIWVGHW